MIHRSTVLHMANYALTTADFPEVQTMTGPQALVFFAKKLTQTIRELDNKNAQAALQQLKPPTDTRH